MPEKKPAAQKAGEVMGVLVMGCLVAVILALTINLIQEILS